MAYGYDPAAFDIIREEYEDRRPEQERPLPDRDLPDRVREDDRDRDEARLADDLQKELDKLDDVTGEIAYNDLSDMAEDTQDQPLENALAKIGRRRPTQFRQTGRRSVGRQYIRRSRQFSRAALLPNLPERKTKKKRKVSKYQKEFGKQLKMLKAKHPRTPVTRLMKRAHTATKKAMK